MDWHAINIIMSEAHGRLAHTTAIFDPSLALPSKSLLLTFLLTRMFESKLIRKDFRSRDQRDQLLHFETKSETGIFRVSTSKLGPKLKFSESQFWDRVRDWSFQSLNFETESETQIFWVSISWPSPRLNFYKSQFRDRVRDWHFQSLNIETKSETGIL